NSAGGLKKGASAPKLGDAVGEASTNVVAPITATAIPIRCQGAKHLSALRVRRHMHRIITDCAENAEDNSEVTRSVLGLSAARCYPEVASFHFRSHRIWVPGHVVDSRWWNFL